MHLPPGRPTTDPRESTPGRALAAGAITQIAGGVVIPSEVFRGWLDEDARRIDYQVAIESLLEHSNTTNESDE